MELGLNNESFNEKEDPSIFTPDIKTNKGEFAN